MCLVAIANRASPHFPLIVAANRDESHARPTLSAAWWPDEPILGGRDVVAGGTWLGITRDLRLGAVTNLRESGADTAPSRYSRGRLVADYLRKDIAAARHAADLEGTGSSYAPFHLLLADREEWVYTSNRDRTRSLDPGVHSLSNAAPGSDWPKVTRATAGLTACLADRDPVEKLFALLSERSSVNGRDDRRASAFILDPHWGTRCSTVILIDPAKRVRFVERSFDPQGQLVGEARFEFDAQ